MMKNTPPLVLLIDDEQDILFSSAIILRNAVANRVITLDESSQVLPLLAHEEVAVIVLDLSMPGLSGQELLPLIMDDYPQVQVLIMTASNDIETAVECMKAGAVDYLLKPVDKNRLVTSVTRALEVYRLRNEVNSLKQHLLSGELKHVAAFAPIITRSKKMYCLFRYLESVAGSEQPLLISGETGVGKELFARAIHTLTNRSGGFVPVNIAGLDDLMFSDTLFGHRKGAYTGADQSREGLIARAAGGTLFLDEIGDLNAASQVKLLRLLQENEYYPLGSDVSKQCNARIIVATNRDLPEMIAAGTFRKDLYYRLCVHSCHIPPLRERLEDIPLLLDRCLETAAQAMHKKIPAYPNELVAYLTTYSFPGNVRELQAMLYDAVAQNDSQLLSLSAFTHKIEQPGPASDSPAGGPATEGGAAEMQVFFDRFPTMKEAEEFLISRALAIAHGNQGRAAALLGISRQALNNRLTRKQR
jgi:DNA-binding NtrC family response regulator